MIRVGPILLLLSACSTAGNPGPSDEGSPEMREPRDLRVERVASGAPGQGPRDPRVVPAPSAEALSRDLSAQIRGSGEGTYVVIYGGGRPTGGYSVDVAGVRVEEARVEGDRVTVRVSLEGPSPDAIVTQSLTYPYKISVLRGLSAGGKRLSLVDGEGRELGWPVRRVGG